MHWVISSPRNIWERLLWWIETWYPKSRTRGQRPKLGFLGNGREPQFGGAR